jgi:hypothetical protein
MQSLIRESWELLGEGDQDLIKREIKEALDRDNLGMNMDAEGWVSLLTL